MKKAVIFVVGLLIGVIVYEIVRSADDPDYDPFGLPWGDL